MTELEGRIADLKTQIEFCKSCFSRSANTYQENTMLDQLENSLKIIDSLQAENQQLGEKLEWKPIESAPKDGARFLAYCPYDGKLVTAWWVKSQSGISGYFDNNAAYNSNKITHWMPLPKAPNQLNTKETKGESNEGN